jgi:hypothetical protein
MQNPPLSGIQGFLLPVSFVRLLFNNSEEVKRIRCLRPDSSG